MKSKLANYSGETRRCLVVLAFVLSMMAGSLTVTQNVAAASCPAAQKIQRWEQESRDAVRFSVRLYRFYKLSTQKAAQAGQSE